MEEIEAFTQDLSIFAGSFNTHGPGTVGNDLDKGAPLVQLQFEERLQFFTC